MDNGISRSHDPRKYEQRRAYNDKPCELAVLALENIFDLSQNSSLYIVNVSTKLINFDRFYTRDNQFIFKLI